MSKISTKMRAQQLEQQKAAMAAAAEGPDGLPVASKTAPVTPQAPPMATLFDAAKMGDIEAATRMVEEGADINAKVSKSSPACGSVVCK